MLIFDNLNRKRYKELKGSKCNFTAYEISRINYTRKNKLSKTFSLRF